jgi:transposase
MTESVAVVKAIAPSPASHRDPTATRQRWLERLDRFRAADQTVAAFCAAEGISVPSFYSWRRLLTAEAASPTQPPALVPVRIGPAAPAPIELVLPGGAVLRFAAGTAATLIAAVVRRLGVTRC